MTLYLVLKMMGTPFYPVSFFHNGISKATCELVLYLQSESLNMSYFFAEAAVGRCFPVKFAKFLRTPFFTEHLQWLLLPLAGCQYTFLKCDGMV